MRIVERAFESRAEANAFVEGVEFVNDSSIKRIQIMVETKTEIVGATPPATRFVVIIYDEDDEAPNNL